jgi:hypothetical protein
MAGRLTRVQALLTAAVLASGIGAAAAGGGGGASGVPLASGQVLALIQQAPLRLLDYPSVKVSIRITISTQGQSLTISATGVQSLAQRDGSFSETLPDGLGSMRGLFSQHVLYLRLPSGRTVCGRPWISISLAGLPGANQPTSGTAVLQLLAGASGTVQRIGTQTVDGVATTHYRVSVSYAEAIARVPEQLRTLSESELGSLGISPDQTFPVDVWLDAQGLARQMQMTMHLADATTTMRVALRGTHQTVHISLPASADVYPLSSLSQLPSLMVACP